MNTNIHVNVNEIPPEVAERIGCAFLGFHKRFQQSPELMAVRGIPSRTPSES